MCARNTDDEPAYGDFLALFSRHSRRIYGFVRTLVVDANDANDVYQNTTLCLWQKFGEFRMGTNFFAWACQVARLEALKVRHDKSRSLRFSDEVMDLLAVSVLDRTNEFDQREQALSNCLKRLKQEDKALIEQRYSLDRKPKEIAEANSQSVFAIYRSLSRIHDQLFRCIARKMAERS